MVESGWFRGLVAVAGVVLLTTGGCQCRDTRDGGPWVLETGVDADAQVDVFDGGDALDTRDTQPDTFEPDTRDATDAGDAADVPPDTCEYQVTFDKTYFDIAEGSRRAPVISGDSVFTEMRDQAEPNNGDIEVAKVWPDKVTWTYNGVPDRLVAGEAGRVLVHRGSSHRPVIITENAVKTGPETFSDRWEGPGYGYQQGSVRPFDGERFAFVLQNDPNAVPGWVGYYDGKEVHEVHIKEWTRKPVSLIPNGFVLATRTGPLSGGGNLDVMMYREGEGLQRLTETEVNERDVVATSEAIFYNTDNRVVVFDLETKEKTELYPGDRRITCSPVGADGERLVYSCEPGSGDDSHDRLILGRELYYWDGDLGRHVPTGGGTIYSARIHGPHVVWAEYARFGGGPGEIGEIRYWRVGSPRSQVVDTIGAPCRTCAVEYPDVNLSVGDGIIAWNYARPTDKDRKPPRTNGGLAVVRDECGDPEVGEGGEAG